MSLGCKNKARVWLESNRAGKRSSKLTLARACLSLCVCDVCVRAFLCGVRARVCVCVMCACACACGVCACVRVRVFVCVCLCLFVCFVVCAFRVCAFRVWAEQVTLTIHRPPCQIIAAADAFVASAANGKQVRSTLLLSLQQQLEGFLKYILATGGSIAVSAKEEEGAGGRVVKSTEKGFCLADTVYCCSHYASLAGAWPYKLLPSLQDCRSALPCRSTGADDDDEGEPSLYEALAFLSSFDMCLVGRSLAGNEVAILRSRGKLLLLSALVLCRVGMALIVSRHYLGYMSERIHPTNSKVRGHGRGVQCAGVLGGGEGGRNGGGRGAHIVPSRAA